ncbi:hypothetical protein EDL96_06910 [Kocuria soli]|uniref:Aminoacyl-transfer RNA synthetases class-II family profile domain-containing protein n=1 Tax=Kocuria soli TaxID=2485125 RepID=A0A3N3ZQ48_9MICC|nr:hypothetical protein [Kocuria soli]ROZ63264.1 hypothetical protein EDL96_06910 [Kocuria soli]
MTPTEPTDSTPTEPNPTDQTEADPTAEAEVAFERELLEAQWLLPTLGPGVTGTGVAMEAVIRGLEVLARQRVEEHLDRPGAVRAVRFPPVNGRSMLERTDYVASFPQLLGTIDVFTGDTKAHRRLLADREAGLPWDGHLHTSDYALVPAACHPLYAWLSMTGNTAPAHGEPNGDGGGQPETRAVVDGTVWALTGDCFRNEPSPDPMRLVSFRMLEFVLLGTPEQALAHRGAMLELGSQLLRDLGLTVSVEGANDPFFGRAGVMLAKGQRAAELKFEITTQVYAGRDTAIASGNCHEEHFGAEFGLATDDGAVAHSACFGFGLERIALALARRHGTDLTTWPARTRDLLGLEQA